MLDRGFGANGRVVTQTDLGGAGWLDAQLHLAEGPGGTIVAAVGKTVFRYLPDGSLDPSFGDGGRLTVEDPEGMPFTLHDLAVDGEGRVILTGDVMRPDLKVRVDYLGTEISAPLAAVIRYSPDGELDSTFAGGKGFLLTEFGQPPLVPPYFDKATTSTEAVTADSEGRLTLIGSVGEYVTHFRSVFEMVPRLVVKLTAAGQLDPSFGNGGVGSETDLAALSALAPYGRDELLLSGPRDGRGEAPPSEVLGRLGADGEVDRSFGHNGFSSNLFVPPLSDIAVDRFGRILTLGGRGVLRLTPQGIRDRRFGYRGGTTVRLPGSSTLSSVAIEPAGRILLAGTQAIPPHGGKADGRTYLYRRSFTVVALSRHGNLDRRFGHRGWVATRFGRRSRAEGEEAFVDRRGRLVIGGTVARPDLAPTGGIALARYRLGR
jgi:uncharacterized delta-60 repeat protein